VSNGEAIYATRPWTSTATATTAGQQVRYTQKGSSVCHL
jgi:hypothetical protein